MTDHSSGQRHSQHPDPGSRQPGNQQSHPQHPAAQYSYPQHPDPLPSVPRPPAAPQQFAGQPYQGPHPAPRPPKRSTPVWPWVLIGVMVLLCGGCFGIVGMSSDAADDGSSTTTFTTGAAASEPAVAAPGEAAPPKPDAAPAGAAVRDGKFEFRVTAVDGPVKTVGDNQFLQSTAQGEYILVHVSVTNIGDRPQTYFGSNQKLFDAQGRQYENDTMAEVNLHDHMATTINPGNTIDVVLAFDLPVGTVADKLQLHDSMFSGGAKVALR
ncbi:DUF4352 domain-containing protein [Nocardia higoensis]|uniref:DUF4352 domain-containing protein n=1 Tax=Nocardia higoensis TaxID=228599 RepID=UPI001FE22CB4|nr:DUF4352 domain-containing protein [Nocardia higoensis]